MRKKMNILELTVVLLGISLSGVVSADVFEYPVTEGELTLERMVWSAESVELRSLEKTVTALIQEDPFNHFGHYLLSQLYLRLFTLEPDDLLLLKASSDLAQQAIELAPSDEIGYIALANVLDTMGHSGKAEQLLKSTFAKVKQSSWRHDFILARLKAETHGLGEVLKHLHKAASDCHNQVSIVMPYLMAALDTRYSGAELTEQLNEWERMCPNKLVKLSIAEKLSISGEHKKALSKYREVLKNNPHDPIALLNFSIINYHKFGKTAEARKSLMSLLTSSKEATRKQRYQAHTHLGVIALKKGDEISARAHFNTAIELTDNAMSVIDQARKEFTDNKMYAALSNFYEDLTRVLTGNAVIFALNAEILSDKLGNHKESIGWYTDAILLDPSKSEYYNGAGLAYYRIKNIDLALDMFRAAVQVDPSDGVSHYNQACMLALLGDSENALASLGDAVAIDPALKQTASEDPDLKALRVSPRFRSILGPNSTDSIAH